MKLRPRPKVEFRMTNSVPEPGKTLMKKVRAYIALLACVTDPNLKAFTCTFETRHWGHIETGEQVYVQQCDIKKFPAGSCDQQHGEECTLHIHLKLNQNISRKKVYDGELNCITDKGTGFNHAKWR